MPYYRNVQAPNMPNRFEPDRQNSPCSCDSYSAIKISPVEHYKEPLAMAYVPWQSFGERYSNSKGYEVGTIFPELNKPFLAGARECRN